MAIGHLSDSGDQKTMDCRVNPQNLDRCGTNMNIYFLFSMNYDSMMRSEKVHNFCLVCTNHTTFVFNLGNITKNCELCNVFLL